MRRLHRVLEEALVTGHEQRWASEAGSGRQGKYRATGGGERPVAKRRVARRQGA